MKNRKFLVERDSAKDFLLNIDDKSAFQKFIENPDMPIYMSGKLTSGNKINRNLRIYPWEILKKECIRYMEEEIADRQAIGELDHPEEDTTPRYKYASHIIEDMTFKGEDVYGKIKILNAHMPDNSEGRRARGLILNNVNIGISSRAFGSVEEEYMEQYDAEVEIVEDDLSIVCWDLVSKPSNFGSTMRLTESAKLKKKKKPLYENQCFDNICECNCHIKDKKIKGLSENEKMYLKIIGIEKFLQLKSL